MVENIEILKSVKFDYGIIELRSDDILTYLPNKDVKSFTIPKLKLAIDIFLDITNGNPKLYFCDISHFTDSTSAETKTYMKSTLHLFAKACAVTEKSAFIAYLAHIFLYLYKPEVPVKLFKTKLEAITWMKSLEIK